MLRVLTRFPPPALRCALPTNVVVSAAVATTSSHLSLGGQVCHGACGYQTRGFAIQSQATFEIPRTQTAVVFEQHRAPLQVRTDWPVVQPNDLMPGQVLVRLAYSGVCHTDLHVWMGDWPIANKLPLVGGHEGAGYVAAIGKDTRTKLQVGDAVGVKWLAHSCLGCEDCRKGHEPTCDEAQLHGFTVDGSFQQWCVSFADHVTPIPTKLPLASAAPILCAGVTVYKALKEFGGNAGDTVVIPGAGGGLGHLACQYARAMGYRVIAIDTGDDKRALVESYGVTDFIDYQHGAVVEQVKAATADGRGAQGSIVVASSSAAYSQALACLRPYGSLILVAVPKDATMTVGVLGTVLHAHRIVGSCVGNRQDAVEALRLAATGDVKVNYELTKLTDLAGAFDRLAGGAVAGRIVLDCE